MKRSCRSSLIAHRLTAASALALLALATAMAWAGPLRVADRWRAAGSIEITAGAASVTIKRGAPISMAVQATPSKTVSCHVWLLSPAAAPAPISNCAVSERSDQRVVCRLTASSPQGESKARLAIDSRGEVTILPDDGCRGARITADYQFCLLPSRHLDDCVFSASQYAKLSHLYLPSECLLVGLLADGDALLCVGWPPAGQLPSLVLSGNGDQRRIEAIDVQGSSSPIYVGILAARGIWHSVKLDDSFEDRDVPLKWKPPFNACWKVELKELDVPTAFYLVQGKHRRWRPTVNWFIRPLYKQGGKVYLHLSKRMTCKGLAFIYPPDRHDLTPYAFLARHMPKSIGAKVTEMQPTHYVLVLDPTQVPPRVMDTHCFGRDVLRYTTLAVGNVAREKTFLRTHIYDRRYEALGLANYSFQRAVDWLNTNIAQMRAWAKRENKNPAVRDYLLDLVKMLVALRKDYFNHLGGESSAHVIRLIEENTRAFLVTLDEDAGIELCPKLLYHIRKLNNVNSMNETLSRLFGTETRRVFQEAAYRGVANPATARYAEVIRESIRRHLQYRSWESAERPDYGMY